VDSARVHHRDPFAPILREHGRIGGGQGFEDGLFHGEVRFVDGADDGVVFLHQESDVNVDLQSRCQHLARIAVVGVIVDHKILREDVQDHAIHELYARGARRRAVHIALFDFAHEADIEHAASIGAAERWSAGCHDGGSC
jgi:hypothetical protein